ncbi:hypothetical protein PSTG_17581 [Puccinia striiformis f. sp. tritici PST-78]|uniref:Uncharacterized protein n=1 Tax=Puccinia striiformis f. sp. tritici PST-78 TaxID=1165861 RepID=A0A0L0UPI2_9BASI|nr:hypothetical protein PSTG_17581 [Puccinia striiformis f. sp. tritici PST-78]
MDELYAKSMKELTTLQASLKEQKIMDLPNELKYYQQHNHAIGYLALALSLMTFLIICFRYYKNGKNRQNPHPTTPIECTMESIQESNKNMVPTPAPRQTQAHHANTSAKQIYLDA